MKADIHPKYIASKIKCACGAIYETRSTKGDQSIEICAACHPYFTGKTKVLDSAGRVDKFKKKYKMK